ncbi:MAG: VOC family protein [Flavobacteriales bacterium]
METILTGIQQVGIGVNDVDKAFSLYKNMGVNVSVFDDEAVAKLMVRYTGGEPRKRRAMLAISMNGGGGFEIWQFKDRKSLPYPGTLQPGDLGINAVKIKCTNPEATHQNLKSTLTDIQIGDIQPLPDGSKGFWLTDSFGNHFQFVKGNLFKNNTNKNAIGGVCGSFIGVSNVDQSKKFYSDVLGLKEVVYDVIENFQYPGSEVRKVRRVLLQRPASAVGGFSKFFGHVQIELIQALEATPVKLFENRFWGDLGYIHLCFDTINMEKLEERCKAAGHEFTVDSKNSFDMGESAGRFSYVEDPDGTLIEFVETHKIPMLKAIGWYMNLNKRGKEKPLPGWFFFLLGLKRFGI